MSLLRRLVEVIGIARTVAAGYVRDVRRPGFRAATVLFRFSLQRRRSGAMFFRG
jgi:hypothetical protein